MPQQGIVQAALTSPPPFKASHELLQACLACQHIQRAALPSTLKVQAPSRLALASRRHVPVAVEASVTAERLAAYCIRLLSPPAPARLQASSASLAQRWWTDGWHLPWALRPCEFCCNSKACMHEAERTGIAGLHCLWRETSDCNKKCGALTGMTESQEESPSVMGRRSWPPPWLHHTEHATNGAAEICVQTWANQRL